MIPSPQIVGFGQNAVFQCLHSVAPNILWALNGTVVGDNDFPGVVTIGSSTDMNGDMVSNLNITAISDFNNTRVTCIAIFRNFSRTETTPVSLLIQGIVCIIRIYLYKNCDLIGSLSLIKTYKCFTCSQGQRKMQGHMPWLQLLHSK